MISSAEKYVGKSFKYLAINDKSLRRLIVNHRPDDGTLTVDYLVDILTPGSREELITDVTNGVFTESLIANIIENASNRFIKIVDILLINYWDLLTEIVRERKKWDSITLLAEVLKNGNRRSEVMYYMLVELYIQLCVMRTAGDCADMSIRYEDIEDYTADMPNRYTNYRYDDWDD